MRNGIKWLPVFLSILLLIAGLASAEEAVPMDFQTLQPGDAGEQVTLLQQKLADAGYLEAASGVYDEATEQAVLRLQQNYGLEETGVADIETQEVIFGGCYLVLEEGMSGPKVAALQERLKALSLFSDEADGVFGLTTKQSVEIFQQLYSIPVTGVADVETLTQLYSDLSERDILVAPTPSPTPGITSQNEPFKKKLSYGSTSASVKKLQERLMELGYFTYKKTTTGFYKNTQQAVKDFQKNNGLKVTGTVDKETWDAIFNDDQVVTASQTPRPSPTPAPQQYYMDVDVANQVTRVYTYDENHEYTKLVRVMICSTGRSKYPSPTGVITLPGRKARWCTFPNWGGGTAMYWTKIDENVAFHSILYANYDPDRPNMSSFNNLGKRASHGCIRLHTMDAKWVYDNIGAGTKVYIHNDSTTDKELVAFARYRKGNAEDTVISESEYSALPALKLASDQVSSTEEFSPELQELAQRLSSLYYELEDISSDLRRQRDGITFSPEELDQKLARLDLLSRLMNKHSRDVEGLIEYREELAQRLENINDISGRQQALEKEIHKAGIALRGACNRLSDARRAAASSLQEKISLELSQLNFSDSRFSIEFRESDEFTEEGTDIVEFMISTNRGEPLKPLSKIASGGEMSRIMLAFKKIIGDYDGIPTMIFDEIDAGISGIAATVVGRKMREISRNHQIICITHLPQIAAFGDHHYRIQKTSDETATYTSVVLLDEEETVVEIARLLGGETITETTLASARELLEASRQEG